MEALALICRASTPSARWRFITTHERVIVPFALVDTGLRLHVLAFDRESGELRDFFVTRIGQPILINEEPQSHERPDNDIQGTRIVELNLVPHPRLGRSEIRMARRMRVRAAVTGYMLLRWSVNVSPNHSLKEEQYQLWLVIHWPCMM